MTIASFQFSADLERFVRQERRGRPFAYDGARAASLKNAIDALGVPHTEVGAVLVNGEPATLQRMVREGDVVQVRAAPSTDPGTALFVADAHLGGLARFLRMLGFDTAHEPGISDGEIRHLARTDDRIVLTRDRDLLKCRDVLRGHYVRALKPEAQLQEVAERYRLAERARPFTRCLHCNLPLAPIEKAAIMHRLPPQVAELQQSFTHCAGCDRVYWPGSHYARMRAALGEIMGSDQLSRSGG